MTRLVLCVVAALVASGACDPVPVHHKVADPVVLDRQLNLLSLYFHPHEPIHVPEQKVIASSWDLEQNVAHYGNVTAVKVYSKMLKHGWVVPRSVPFAIHNPVHKFEAETLFNVFFSAKDYDTFYKTAVYVRDKVNEGLFVYVLNVAVLHRSDTQGLQIPPIYEVFPSLFHNGEVMNIAQRINTHGKKMVEHYPTTYVWDDNVVIKLNETYYPYVSNEDLPLAYFTHDHGLNAFYYYSFALYPSWLGGEVVPLVKDRRGEWFWFIHKQILARYYMERLSNGFGEIPVLGLDVVEEGHNGGLVYHNGVPFPVRPNYFNLEQPEFVEAIKHIVDYEYRIRDAIEKGFFISSAGEHVPITSPEAIDIIGRLVESNVDSPNWHYYKDFISVWKALLGNSIVKHHQYHNGHVPLVVPSVLENYETALRDPAFYMIWKRVLNIFHMWHKQLPPYQHEELVLPSVAIEQVEVDKLVTYFEQTYVNVSNHLHMTEQESQVVYDDVSVLVQRPRLNHKVFKVRVHVKSEVAKTVVVKFFLAPKYDSSGNEIPLHLNTENFLMFDMFKYDLPQGESVIKRSSSENGLLYEEWQSGAETAAKVELAKAGQGQFFVESPVYGLFPQRLILPKGRVGGMPFVFLVYIQEYHAPKVAFGSNFDSTVSYGVGSGARYVVDDRMGFPLDRPLHVWQVEDVHNLHVQDVLIYHKHTPEIDVPHNE